MRGLVGAGLVYDEGWDKVLFGIVLVKLGFIIILVKSYEGSRGKCMC